MNNKLNLILGRSGSGKSFYVREKIKKLCFDESERIMLIIPEQDSFETEKMMLKFLGAKNSNRIVITSFKRLVDFVFRQVGGFAGNRLNDSGRNIFMHLAIEEVREQIELYNQEKDNNELVDIMVSALKEFKMNSISTETLLEYSKKVNDKILRGKIKDTALILNAYNALIERSYIDPLDDLTKLSKKLSEGNIFNGYKVFIDEFDGFTQQEISVLKHILKQCDESFITLRVDDLELYDNGMNLFSPVQKTVRQLIKLSKENSIVISKPIVLDTQYRFNSNELKLLERNIFRNDFKIFNNNINDISIYKSIDPYDEINFVSNTIKKMVIENDYYYSDFAIIARNLTNYKEVIESIFDKHNIPYFMDVKQDIDSKPIMNAVLTLFDIVNSYFNTEHIFTYLKTGISNISSEDVSIIENYVMLWGINNKEWLSDFKLNPSGFSAKVSKSDEELLIKINDIRNRIITPILKFSDRIKNETAKEITKAIYDFFIDIEADKRILELSKNLESLGEYSLAEEQIRLWDLLIDILDQIFLVLKDKKITVKKYYDILKLVVNTEKISFIPQSLDEVIIGDADRIRLKDKKVVFIIGAIEGEFPRSPVSSGVFSDFERKSLISLGLPMYESLEKLVIEERFLAYTSITSSSDKLFLSWPMSSLLGNSNYPSSIIKFTKKIFPNLHIMDECSLDEDYNVYSEKPAFELCAINWNNNTKFSESLKFYFKNNELYKTKINALEKASSLKSFKFNDTNKVDMLFGKEMTISASQLERFYLCKFQYFCRYGLLVKMQKPYVFNSLEYGKLIHFLLEDILSFYDIKSLKNMNEHLIGKVVDKSLKKYVEKYLGGFEEKDKRFKYLFYRVKSSICILIDHIINEFSQNEFVISGTEVDVSDGGDVEPLTLETLDGSKIKVRGKIDRVDIMKKNGNLYVRVIDYKTGVKEFKLSDVIYGLNTQMLIYLMTLCKNSKKSIIPSGVLYMPCNKPLINADKNIKKDKLDIEINKKLKMNGLVLNIPEVIKGMESDAKGVFIPTSLNDGELKKTDNVVSLAQIGSIMKYLEKLIISMAEVLKSGDISANPVIGEHNACKYCEYKSICGYEDKVFGKIIERIDKDKAIDVIEKSVGEKDG